ncbi:hypothetical protein OIU76_008467 [Salix suchowensis]|nr:hypothetical protein OIU76_008467 [Salix suchowensis]
MAQEEGQNGGAEKTVVEVFFKSVKPQLFKLAVLLSLSAKQTRSSLTSFPLCFSSLVPPFIVADLSDDSSSTKGGGAGFAMCLETEDLKAAVAKAVRARDQGQGPLRFRLAILLSFQQLWDPDIR